MNTTKVPSQHILCYTRLTGLAYVFLNGQEYRLQLSNECLSTKLLFRASLIAIVNSGWLQPITVQADIPSESYVLNLPVLTKEVYEYDLVEEYFLTSTLPSKRRVGVTLDEYLTVQLDVLGTSSVDPFQGPVPEDFTSSWAIGNVSHRKPHVLPILKALPSFPAESNPFHYDHSNMGCQVSGGWFAMYNQHAGEDRDGKPYKEPEYLILVNSRTGQRFKLDFSQRGE